jgi:Domain of unknown function (DUF2431)
MGGPQTELNETKRNETKEYLMRDVRSDDLVKRRVLIVGDGDLSYAAMVAPAYQAQGTQLTATVLEQEAQHCDTYTRGSENCTAIVNHGHQVLFGVDATKLEHTFAPESTFHVIQWNFPHWNGKTNNKRNRDLLNSFFRSAAHVTIGTIQLALMDHQGGAHSSSLGDWKQSWQPALHAAQHELLLLSVSDFKDEYPKSAYRGRNAAFRFHGDAKLYTFARHGTTVPGEFQLHCYYQMLFRHDDDTGEQLCRELQGHTQRMLPQGWIALVKKKWIRSNQDAYLVAFFGESKAITQEEADQYRMAVEKEMARLYPLHYVQPARQWPISHPIPASLFPREI